jgi:Phage Terminase
MRISGPSPSDPTSRWASDVLAGRIIAGELVGLAAERHLRDLKDGASRGLYFDAEAAARVIGFFPALLSITAGAHEGKPFNLLPWHVFTVGSLFGWKKESGRLRFRQGWLETGKGQAKSPLMAGIGLYMAGWHGVKRSEVYAIGQDRATANVLFKDIRLGGGQQKSIHRNQYTRPPFGAFFSARFRLAVIRPNRRKLQTFSVPSGPSTRQGRDNSATRRHRRMTTERDSTENQSAPDLLYGVQAIAGFLGLTRHQAQHRIDEGNIPTFRMGGRTRGTICARRSTLRTWLADLERQGSRSTGKGA